MTYHTRVTEAGELVISAGVARELGLRPGDPIEIDRDNAGLHLRARPRDEVDRFLRERRDDWDD